MWLGKMYTWRTPSQTNWRCHWRCALRYDLRTEIRVKEPQNWNGSVVYKQSLNKEADASDHGGPPDRKQEHGIVSVETKNNNASDLSVCHCGWPPMSSNDCIMECTFGMHNNI